MMIEHRPPAMTFFIIASLLCFIAEEGKRRGSVSRGIEVRFGVVINQTTILPISRHNYLALVVMIHTKPKGKISKSWCDPLDGHEERSIHFSWGKYCCEGTKAAEFAREGQREDENCYEKRSSEDGRLAGCIGGGRERAR